jgi:raffinose/stachyose/melibiose transport system substrate-binding protein
MTEFASVPRRLAVTTTLAALLAFGTGTAHAQKAQVRWIDQPRGAVDKVVDERFVTSFHAANPSIELKITRQEDHEKIVRMSIQAGTAPDLIQTNGPAEVIDLVRAGKIVPLDDVAKKYGWAEKMLPWAYQAGLVNGKLYSVPQTYESMLLYYNKEAFAQNGWTVPKSAADFERLCAAAKDKGITCFAHTTGGKSSRGEWWIGWHLNAGAGPDAFFRTLKGEKPWAEMRPHLERNATWIRNGWYSAKPDLYFGLSHDENWAMVGSGKALMRVAGTWDLGRMRRFCNDKCDWVAAPPLGVGVGEHFQLAIGESISISADSKNPAAAAAVLDHLFNDRARAASIIEGANFAAWVVPLKWQASDFSATVDARLVRFLTSFSDVTGQGRIGYTTWTFLPPKTRLYLFEALDEVITGKKTVDAYVNEIQPIFDRERSAIGALPQPRM